MLVNTKVKINKYFQCTSEPTFPVPSLVPFEAQYTIQKNNSGYGRDH